MNTKDVHQLTAIKLLLNEAVMDLEGAGLQRALAILHAHDALDWTLQIAYFHPKIGGKKNTKMYLSDYAEGIDKLMPGLIDLGNVSKLNTLRVGFKHDFIFPDPDQTKNIIYWVENQINTIAQQIFQVSLLDIDFLVALENGAIKDKVVEADKYFSQNNMTEAFSSLAVAFEMTKFELQQHLEKTTGKRPVFRTDLTFSNSFFLHLDGIGRDFARAWDQIIDSTEYLIDMSFISFLGINASSYFRFLSATPRPVRTMNGQYHVDVSDKLISKMRPQEYKECREFLIDTVLKVQNKTS